METIACRSDASAFNRAINADELDPCVGEHAAQPRRAVDDVVHFLLEERGDNHAFRFEVVADAAGYLQTHEARAPQKKKGFIGHEVLFVSQQSDELKLAVDDLRTGHEN